MSRRKRNLGRMHHRITIMQTVRADDGGGGTTRSDVVIATVWGRVQTVTAREMEAYGQLQERVTHSIMIRYRDDVDNGQTVVWLNRGATEPSASDPEPTDGTALYVKAAHDADPDGRPGEFMLLMCEERVTI